MPRTEVTRVRTAPKPSLLSRVADAVRAYTVGPLTSRSPELARYFGGSGSSSAGVAVNEHNIQNFSAVSAAVGLVSDDVSSLPLMLYKRLKNGGKDRFEDHPLYRLLHDEPNPEMGTMVWRRTLQTHVMIWGNGYSEIERDRVGRPMSLWPLCPERVRVERNRAGDVQYIYHHDNGTTSTIPASDMIHLVGRSHDGTVGASIVERARESIGLALAAEKFGATFFGNGATFGGVIAFPGPKPPEMSDQNYREQLERRHQGVERAHKLLALYNGAKYVETGVEPDNAQFLETRTFQIREVARWFKVPPHKLADLADATFSNVEQQNTEYYVSAIRPWLVLWEQELSRKLISRLERSQQFIEHSVEGFLRGDSAARASFYTSLFNIGAITINEVRGYENLDPLDGGDQSFVQVNNLMPLSKVSEYAEAVIAAQQPKPAPKPDDGVSEEDDDEELNSAITAVESRIAEQTQALTAAVAKVADARALEQQWQTERESLQREIETTREGKSDIEVMLSVAERERDDAKHAADAAQKIADQAGADLLALTAERNEHIEAAKRYHAVAEELRLQLAEQRAAAERLAQAHAEAESKRLIAETQALDGVRALSSEQSERAKVEAVMVMRGDRLKALALAQRGLLVDAFERLLAREMDRARKAQASVEKLRAWRDGFYPLHAETCRAVLRPVVAAWAASVGVAADVALERIVREHIERSDADLRRASDATDADELAANLALVFKRWETERAHDVADALMAEGERYGH